jgi:hypothetical protein
MQLDRNMLERLLTMNDEQLGELVKRIAREAGVDPAQLGLNPENIQSVRQALGGASAEDVAQMNAIYQAYREHRRGR